MSLQVIGLLKSSVDSHMKNARAQAINGDRKAAANSWSEAASDFRSLERADPNDEKKIIWRNRAEECDVMVARMSSPPNSVAASPTTASDVQSQTILPKPAPPQEEVSNEFVSQIEGMIHTSNLTWSSIGGLDETKEEIKLAYGIGLANTPQGVSLDGWKSMLFHGPPGTGKTMLAAATSGSIQATFFNVQVGQIVSKYFGESPKLISTLFEVARDRAPSVIFFDEFEALSSQRTGDESGAERRVLSTLLTEMDGLGSKGSDNYVLTIASTNVPWSLDKAILSRFQKKIYVPLPDEPAREAILEHELQGRGIESDISYTEFARQTDGYSGRELAAICQTIVNSIISSMNPQISELVDQGMAKLRNYTLKLRPINRQDVENAIRKHSPDTKAADVAKYATWSGQDS